MAASEETLARVKAILRTSLNHTDAGDLPDDMPLTGGEFDLDSLDILLLITNIEKGFDIRVRDEKVDRSAFASIRSLADLVESLRASK